MELRHLEYFIAVAEELHFGRAAARLKMTQPPLSQQIQQLEREIGVTLFVRTNRHVVLSQAGEVFLHEARKVFAQLRHATESAQRAARGQIGRIVVGFVGSATFDVLPQMIRAYMERFPDVEVALQEMSTPRQLKALDDGGIDVGFVRPLSTDMAVSVEVIQHSHCVAAIPKHHPWAAKPSVVLKDFADQPLIVVSRTIWPEFYDEIIGLCRATGFSPVIRQEATEFQTIIGLVAAGIGVSIVPASAQNLHVRDVLYREIEGVAPSADMALAWRSNEQSAIVRAFLGVVRSVVLNR